MENLIKRETSKRWERDIKYGLKLKLSGRIKEIENHDVLCEMTWQWRPLWCQVKLLSCMSLCSTPWSWHYHCLFVFKDGYYYPETTTKRRMHTVSLMLKVLFTSSFSASALDPGVGETTMKVVLCKVSWYTVWP